MPFSMLPTLSGASRRAESMFPPLSPEEEDALTRELLGKSMGALQYIGETLDKPGRAVRGLLSGRPGELLNLIPFSDAMGLTDPKQSVSGRQLLTEMGLTRPNDPNRWEAADFAGFATEVLTDPLTYLLSPAAALTQAGKAAKATGILTGKFGTIGGRMTGTLDDALKAIPDPAMRANALQGVERWAVKHGYSTEKPFKWVAEGPTGSATVSIPYARRVVDGKEVFVKLPQKRLDTLLSERLGGLVGFSPVPMGQARSVMGTGPTAQKIAAGMDVGSEWLRGTAPARWTRALFDKAMQGVTYLPGQKMLGPLARSLRSGKERITSEAWENLRKAPEFASDDQIVHSALRSYAEHGMDWVTRNEDLYDEFIKKQPEGLSQLARDSIDAMKAEQDTAWQRAIDLGIVKETDRMQGADFAHFFRGSTDPGHAKINPDILFRRREAIARFDSWTVEKMSRDPKLVGEKALKGEAARKHVMKTYMRPTAADMRRRAGVAEDVADFPFGSGQGQIADDDIIGQVLRAARQRDVDKVVQQYAHGKGVNPVTVQEAVEKYHAEVLLPEYQQNLAEWQLRYGALTKEELRKASKAPGYMKKPTPPKKYAQSTMDKALDAYGGQVGGTAPVVSGYQRGVQKLLLDTNDEAERIVRWAKDRSDEFLKGPTEAGHRHMQFGKSAVQDNRDYLLAMDTRNQTGEAMQSMFADVAQVGDAQPGMMSLSEALADGKMGFRAPDKAADSIIAKLAQRDAKFAGVSPDDVFIPRDAYETAIRVEQKFSSPQEIKALGKFFDSMTNLFKTGVTAWPAFHVRNVVSGLVQNGLSGAYQNFTDGLRYSRMARDFMNGKTVKGLQDVLDGVVQGAKGMSDEALTRRLKELTHTYDLVQHHLGEVLGESGEMAVDLGKGPVGPLQRLMSEAPGEYPISLGVEAKRFGAGLRKGLTSREEAAKAFLPWKQKGVFGATEDTNILVKAHRNMGVYGEGTVRVSGWLGWLAQGIDPSEAAARIRAAHVDYTNLSNFEKAFARRAFPFYTFQRGISEYLARQLLQHPGGPYGQALRATNAARSDDAFVPDYVSESAAIPVSPGRYITQLGLMHESPSDLFAIGPTPARTVERTGQKLASMLNPLVKLPIEASTGINLYTGRPQRELYQYPSENRLLNMVLGNTPLSRAIHTSRRVIDPRKGVGVKALGLTSGIGVTDLSGGVERAKEMAARRATEEMMLESPRFREFTNLYVPQELRSQMTPTEIQLMRLYQTQQQRRREIAKQRAALGT